MKFFALRPPRIFTAGIVDMHDCGRLRLDPNEQVTFLTEGGGELDVARKEWGFYATPSLNGRLRDFGLRTSLVRNKNTKRFYILIVESGKETLFYSYLNREDCEVICWLDSSESLESLRKKIG